MPFSLLCEECGHEEVVKSDEDRAGFVANGLIAIRNSRYHGLLMDCFERIPGSGHRIHLPTEIRTRNRGSMPGVVGLTTFSVGGFAPNGAADEVPGTHTITFYTHLMDRLSDKAATAVMAHELAHAWLNEHIRPEASKIREDDADMLAEMWGFGPEMEALSAETEPIR